MKEKYYINEYNEEYIYIYTIVIINKYFEHFDNENETAQAWSKLYKVTDKNLISVTLHKNSYMAQILMNDLEEFIKEIYKDDIIKACTIATYENNVEYMNKLSKIIIHYNENTPKNAKEFAKIYGAEITDFILNNNNIKEYRKMKNGILPYEHKKNVYLYEEGKIQKVKLPEPTINKGKARTKTK